MTALRRFWERRAERALVNSVFRARRWPRAIRDRMPINRITHNRGGRVLERELDRMGQGAWIIQVGTNDGVSNDPLRAHILRDAWRGLLCEPVPYLHDQLVALYADTPGITPLAVAVSSAPGPLPFFTLPEDLEARLGRRFDLDWRQLSSLNRAVLDSHLDEETRAQVIALDLPTRTLNGLVEEHGLPRLDLLHIDAEGHDAEVLDTLDLSRIAPRLILLEHRHLDEGSLSRVKTRLAGHGYDTWMLAEDLLAVR